MAAREQEKRHDLCTRTPTFLSQMACHCRCAKFGATQIRLPTLLFQSTPPIVNYYTLAYTTRSPKKRMQLLTRSQFYSLFLTWCRYPSYRGASRLAKSNVCFGNQ